MIVFKRHALKRAFVLRLTPNMSSVLARLHASSFAIGWPSDAFVSLLTSPGVFGLGLQAAKAWRGFILLRVAADEAEILTLATLPGWRGLGIGKQLVHHALAQAAARGARTCHLEVAASNTAACQMYQRLGFQINGRRQAYYKQADGQTEDALQMKREI